MKKTIQVPTSWADITIRRFQDYTRSIDIAKTDREKVFATITTMCGLTDEEAEALPQKDANKIVESLAFLLDAPSGDEPLVQTFVFREVAFGFIPNWTRLTLGEYVDLETYTASGNMVENLHKAMAVMYRPINNTALHQYDIVEYVPNEDMEQVMLDLTMDIAVSASVFFYNIAERFAADMRHYLNQLKDDPPTTRSGINGVGIE